MTFATIHGFSTAICLFVCAWLSRRQYLGRKRNIDRSHEVPLLFLAAACLLALAVWVPWHRSDFGHFVVSTMALFMWYWFRFWLWLHGVYDRGARKALRLPPRSPYPWRKPPSTT